MMDPRLTIIDKRFQQVKNIMPRKTFVNETN